MNKEKILDDYRTLYTQIIAKPILEGSSLNANKTQHIYILQIQNSKLARNKT